MASDFLALGAWLTPAARAALLASQNALRIQMRARTLNGCKIEIRLRVHLRERAESRMLLQELLNLRRILFLDQKLLQIIVVHFHFGSFGTCRVQTIVLN